MKKSLIFLLLLLILAAALYFFREPIIDLLPIDQSGWMTREDKQYLLDEDGDPLTGWNSYEDNLYYFDDSGAMQTGWLELDGSKYYLDAAGRIFSGWLALYENRYYLDEEGKLCTGWLEDGGYRYFLDESDGHMLKGWLDIDGLRYYLDESDGHMVTGWAQTDTGTFYMNPDGVLATGMTLADGELIYFDENGIPVGGWVEEDGIKRYFGEDGRPGSGWLEYEGDTYYLLEDGIPAVGKLVIEEQPYFFTSAGVRFILVNPWHSLPADFEPELETYQGLWLDPACRDALDQMLSDCRAAGYYPRIVSSYRSIADQTVNLQNMINSYLQSGYSYAQAYSTSVQIVAVPGTSEHHLGLAFDIVDSGYPKLTYDQALMPTQQWLMENCWNYGFILRYPKDTTEITGIIWEPWHYRYVGPELAQEIHELGDITLEEYIDNLTADGTTCGGKAPADE